jgi:hypothetical protein
VDDQLRSGLTMGNRGAVPEDTTTRALARIDVTDWERKPYDQASPGPTLSRVRFVHTFSGDIEGTGTLEYLMVIRGDGSASFTGLERVAGHLGGREGTFVLQHTGTFENDAARVTWFVVPGSGTGELEGLRGEGGFESSHSASFEGRLDYSFE